MDQGGGGIERMIKGKMKLELMLHNNNTIVMF
jgi:hypothetical protein